MAAENSQVSGITDSNQMDPLVKLFLDPELRMSSPQTAELNAEAHEALRILREIHAVLVRFRPLLDQLATSPLATRRAMRRAGRDAQV